MSLQKSGDQLVDAKSILEAISELNQFLLRLDRDESKEQERQP